jgi:hypothetical protein
MTESWKTINDLSAAQLQRAEELSNGFNPEILPGTPVTNNSILSEAVIKAREVNEETAYRVGAGPANDPTYVGKEIVNLADKLGAGDLEIDNRPIATEISNSDTDPNSLNDSQLNVAERKLQDSTLANAKLITMVDTPKPTSIHNRVGKYATQPVPKKGFFGRLFGG